MEILIKALEFYRDGWAPKSSGKRLGLTWNPKEELLEDCGNRALEALRAYDAHTEHVWLPISDAPRDGRDVLLTSEKWQGDVVVGSFCFEAWRERPASDSAPLNPTHWMPIPAPPAAAKVTGSAA